MALFEHGGDIYAGHNIRIDFSVNTNPMGIPEAVKQALISSVKEFAHYPDPYCRELRSAIAEFEGIAADNILCGNGAADLIFRLCLSTRPGEALLPAPTFSEYEKAVRTSGGNVRYHMLHEAGGFALTERIVEDITAQTDMVFICNPNNPTGGLTPLPLLEHIAEACRESSALLVIDECFLDFTDGISAKALLDTYDNIVILRAFTKTFCIAGLRLGYILSSNRTLLKQAGDFSQHWGVSVPAQLAGVAALRDAEKWLSDTRQFVKNGREVLAEGLGRLGLRVYPGEANFLLVKGDSGLFDRLLGQGILLRSCENFKGLGKEFVRIAVKAPSQSEILFNTILQLRMK